MTYLKRSRTSLIPTASLPSLVEKLSRASKDIGVMPTQTDTRANIGIITTAAPPSTRRRGGKKAVQKSQN